MTRWETCALAAILPALFSLVGNAQFTKADFERAVQLQENYNKLAIDIPNDPVWQEDTDSFIYRRSVEGGHEFMLVDATALTKNPAFDHAKLAAALSAAGGKSYTAYGLPFEHFHFAEKRSAIEFVADDARWRCDLASYKCVKQGPAPSENDDYDDTPKAENSEEKTTASPDGKWLAFIANYNVWLRSADGKQRFALSEDGSREITTLQARWCGLPIQSIWRPTEFAPATDVWFTTWSLRQQTRFSRSLFPWCIQNPETC